MLVIFDVEGVLLNAEYLPVLANLFGPEKEKQIWDITNKGIRGEINWEEGLRERVHALRGVEYDRASNIAQNLEIMPGARELCSFLKGLGWKLVAVSGGFTIITDRLYSELNIDKIFSNDLVFQDNKLVDVTVRVTSDKSAAVKSYVEENSLSKDEIVVVVDGANDLKLFDLSSFTVGFCAVDVIRDKANIVIDKKDLSLLIPIIKEKFKIKINS
ncbi:phosphoserine phosphatase SerB [Candidatus Nitrosocosmicus arcticus]|uniref:phosphoserine phosphatase n=1 Tax=Candidatus Nitrosocosmicus arcticus TaxID=2035267 RepID=A0A557STA7_9ARCH|nr:phosphoserine phosphatase SerB [Candidatus Nitrosocosmicus arcticus]TVP39841.1 putative phosphoserine phosphatase, HAD-like hydrolase family [Candidatus Nitrosocosmicus arcticus]